MEPGEALGTAAQVAVALAGFAGVVVVFRSGAVHEWSKIDKFRLGSLLINSAVPLVLCMVGHLLLTANISRATVWRWAGGFVAVLFFPIAIVYLKPFCSFSRAELQTAGGSRSLFYVSLAFGTAVSVLQFYNLAALNAFWPFFLGIISLLIAGVFQFVRLVLISPSR